jgi:hypothetical protein
MHPTCPPALLFPWFNAIVGRVSGFVTLFPFASMSLSLESQRLYAGQTWGRLAIWPLKFADFIGYPAHTRLLCVSGYIFMPYPRRQVPGGICVHERRREVVGAGFHRDGSNDPVGHGQ